MEGDPYVGRTLSGRFLLQSIAGSGEIGMVYEGLDQKTNKAVAVKIVHPDVAATHGDILLRSAQTVARLRHAKIAAVMGAGRENGVTFVVTEFLRGETLKHLLERTGPLGPRRAADILFQLCSALAPLHRAGLPHANLKPENVFLVEKADGGDFVKIVDAGSPELFGVRPTNGGHTIIGTPKYFSPEQARGQKAELRSDQFTLGIIGYQLLTGALPFFGATPNQLLNAIANGEPTPVGERTAGVVLPPRLEQIIHRCLSKDAADRYPELRALAKELAAVIKSTQPSEAPRKRPSFGDGRNMSTMVASVDNLAELAAGFDDDDDDDDEDRTVMRSIPQGLLAGVQATPSTPLAPAALQAATPEPLLKASPTIPPPPPSQNDLANIPEPLMFTGALDSTDLAAALADATASLDPAAGASAPRRSAPPAAAPPAGSSPVGSDLTAALAAASGDEGDFDPFDGMATPDPVGRAPLASSPPAGLASDLFDSIEEALDDPKISNPPAPIGSPLATAADFAPIPGDSMESAPTPRRPRSSGGNKLPLILAAVLLLGAGGAAVWWFALRTPENTTPVTRSKPTKPAVPKDPNVAANPATDPKPGDPNNPDPLAPKPEVEKPRDLEHEVVVRLVTEPEGAKIFQDGVELGTAPITVTLRTAAQVNYTAKLARHSDAVEEIDPVQWEKAGAPQLVTMKLEQFAVAPVPVEPDAGIAAIEPKPKPKPKPKKPYVKPKPKKKPKPKVKKKKPDAKKIRDPFAD